jgi:hypothetical protein
LIASGACRDIRNCELRHRFAPIIRDAGCAAGISARASG